jgi:hypothetical protein
MKYAWLFLGGWVSSVYSAFVAMAMWNWFATRILHVSDVSFFEMLGFVWLIRLLTFSDEANQHQWAHLWAVIEHLVPDEKREGVMKIRGEFEDSKTLLWFPVTHIIGNTVTLALGFIVHAFLL